MSLSVRKPSGSCCVMLATFEGERYLQQQLSSLENQTVAHLDVLLSDDGSSDRTIQIAREFAKNWQKGEFKILGNETRNNLTAILPSSSNFRSLIQKADPDFDFYAFSDQDDVWDEDKLSLAQDWLTKNAGEKPALYCSRVRIVDDNGIPQGISANFTGKEAFQNAIVQNIAAGNTIVLNRAAMLLVKEASRNVEFVSHDWWCYLVVTGSGGLVHFSADARIEYRKHANNLVGDDGSHKTRFKKLKNLLSGQYQAWNSINLEALGQVSNLLTDPARKTVEQLEKARRSGPLLAPLYLYRSGAYRQSLLGQLTLYASSLFGKL